MIIVSISNQRSDHHYWDFQRCIESTVAKLRNCRTNLRSFAQSKRAYDLLQLKPSSVQRGLFSAFFAPLRLCGSKIGLAQSLPSQRVVMSAGIVKASNSKEV